MLYFFYGTLMDSEVLSRVTGRRVGQSRVEPAVIDGYARVYAAGAWYPVLVERPGDRTEGLLVRGIDGLGARRLADFEGQDYRLVALPVDGRRSGRVSAWTFMPQSWVRATDRPWDVQSWRRLYGRGRLASLVGRRAGSP